MTVCSKLEIADDFFVHDVDVVKLWARALKLSALEASGLSVDDIEVQPQQRFSQSNASYPKWQKFCRHGRLRRQLANAMGCTHGGRGAPDVCRVHVVTGAHCYRQRL